MAQINYIRQIGGFVHILDWFVYILFRVTPRERATPTLTTKAIFAAAVPKKRQILPTNLDRFWRRLGQNDGRRRRPVSCHWFVTCLELENLFFTSESRIVFDGAKILNFWLLQRLKRGWARPRTTNATRNSQFKWKTAYAEYKCRIPKSTNTFATPWGWKT